MVLDISKHRAVSAYPIGLPYIQNLKTRYFCILFFFIFSDEKTFLQKENLSCDDEMKAQL